MTLELLLTQLKDAYIRENFRRIRELVEELERKVDDNAVSDTIINTVVNASVWRRTAGINAPSSSTTVLDQVNVNDFDSLKYIIKVRDEVSNKTTTKEMNVTNENGSINDVVFVKMYGGSNFALSAVNNSGTFELQLTNNDLNDYNVSIAKLTL